ncbi:MarR family winged helix-turn-helix transcriptional regulator [Sphaerisporangium viridialbum]|uniref:MarR family winged helix-turn-helix transcriptional regulator n=1 Tax=Sphaerisporangium viridialbum TaxID=46189 RepID=UPI003C71C887
MNAPKPIGYWLKHLHNLLEKQFDATLANLGLGRRHWQVLNTLSRREATRDELAAALAPFWTEGEPDLDGVLQELTGWIRTGAPLAGDTLALSDDGRAAHEHMAARIDATRATVLKGLTPDQYAETVRILSVMAGNVESELSDR